MIRDIQIGELLRHKRPVRSLEFFPPKDEQGVEVLFEIASSLKVIGPDFASVTYGAGGSTRQRTLEVCKRLREELGYTVMPHLTCVAATRNELGKIIKNYHDLGFRNIMALRGDPPKGQTTFEPYKDGLRYGSDLVQLIRENYADISIGVGGYPEKHPEASTLDEDLTHLKHKVDSGANFITTQLFFDNQVFFDFVNRCRKIGITAPIIPGIMPVLSFKQIKRITELSHCSLPQELISKLEQTGDDDAAAEMVGTEWALTQIKDLLAKGVPGFHLYVLNRARAALALSEALAEELK